MSLQFAAALKEVEQIQSDAAAALSFAALAADKDLKNGRLQRDRAKVEHFILTQ